MTTYPGLTGEALHQETGRGVDHSPRYASRPLGPGGSRERGRGGGPGVDHQMCPLTAQPMHRPCTVNGATVPKWNTPIAATKRTGSISRTSGSTHRKNAPRVCADLAGGTLSTTSGALGHATLCSGCATSAASWAWLQTAMGRTCFYLGSAPSLSPWQRLPLRLSTTSHT